MTAVGVSPVFGVQFQPQYTSWAAMREGALLADELGYDSLSTWDHFRPIQGDSSGPNFEGWQILAAWGALTSRIRVGMLVTGNTYRHPAVLAKMAATLDHITDGRAILGLGAGWFEAEHVGYGMPFDSASQRLNRLAEAAVVIRLLLNEPRSTFNGTYYKLTDAPAEPKPIQRHLPLLIGGRGERKTLRIVARFADIWNVFASKEVFAHKLSVLRAHCSAVQRDPASIMPTVGGLVVIRDHPSAVEARLEEIAQANHASRQDLLVPISGNPEEVARELAAYWHEGARGFFFAMPAPYDWETLQRLQTEVRPLLGELVTAQTSPADSPT